MSLKVFVIDIAPPDFKTLNRDVDIALRRDDCWGCPDLPIQAGGLKAAGGFLEKIACECALASECRLLSAAHG
jgi:hypothetical protein